LGLVRFIKTKFIYVIKVIVGYGFVKSFSQRGCFIVTDRTHSEWHPISSCS
jgi:hypothetical protein